MFVEVAKCSSLTDAAEALDMSRAMVARDLVSLEQWLGVRLLHRTTRRVSLTDAGAEAIGRCRRVLDMTREVRACRTPPQLAGGAQAVIVNAVTG